INSTSIVWLMKFLKKFENFHIQSNKLKIIWYYKDDDIFETGQDLKSLMNLPINLIRG
ncbi:MAG: DUF1987 family protein, partial [Bacteroidia bacterium]|nr:DUF1987 family protein [Bacteroidia bacterium]